MQRTVLVTYDIDSKHADAETYRKAYEIFARFGLNCFAVNVTNTNNVLLPMTTVLGDVTMGDASTCQILREQFLGELGGAGVPVSRIAVAFVDDFAGIGKPVPAASAAE